MEFGANAYGTMAYILANRIDEANQLLESTENEMHLLPNIQDKEHYIRWSGVLCTSQAFYNKKLGNLEIALDYFEKCIEIFTECDFKFGLCTIYGQIGDINTYNGQFENAMKYYQRKLKLATLINNKLHMFRTIQQIADIHWMRKEFYVALQYYKQSLSNLEGSRNTRITSEIIYKLILLYTDLSDYENAKHYLDKFELLVVESKSQLLDFKFLIAKAGLLRRSETLNELIEAENLYLIVINAPVLDYRLPLLAIINWYEILIKKISLGVDEKEVFQQFTDVSARFKQITTDQRSGLLEVEQLVFESQILLLKLDIRESIELLVQAKIISENKGFHNILSVIREREAIVKENLDKWYGLVEQNVPISIRIAESNIETYIQIVKNKIITLQTF